MLCTGLPLGWWLGFSAAVEGSPRRTLWRSLGLAPAALSLMVGQEAMTRAAGLETQRGTVYQELSGTVISLVCGVLVPLAMAAMALDLWLRRVARHRHGDDAFDPPKRRKRRHRIRAL